MPEHNQREDQVRDPAEHEVQAESSAVVVRGKRLASGHERRSLRVPHRGCGVLVAQVEHREGRVDREEERSASSPQISAKTVHSGLTQTEREVQAQDDQDREHDADEQQQVEIDETKQCIRLELLEVAEDSCRLWPEDEDRRLDDDQRYLPEGGKGAQCEKEMQPCGRRYRFFLGS